MEVFSKTKATFSKLYGNIISCLFFFLFSTNLHSQCGAPDQIPSIDCQDAPLICLQNWCYESSLFPVTGWPGFCGPNTSIHNPQYYAFIAESTNIEIQILVDYCVNGYALQAAILGNCPWDLPDVIDCNPAAEPGSTIVLQGYDLLEPGQTYWLLIDGSAGAYCGYTITSVSNIYMPELNEEISELIFSEDSVQQGYQSLSLEAVPAVSGAHGYYWFGGWNGDTLTSTLPTIEIDVPCGIDPGTYEFCVRAFTGCDTTETEVCASVEVIAPEVIIKPTSTFCLEEFPFSWGNLEIEVPGIYTQTFNIPFACVDTTWEVLAYPETGVGQIDTNVCGYEFYYEGELFDAAGTYLLEYAGQGQNGCDSSAELHLSFDALEFFIESVCEDSQFLLRPNVILHLQNDTILYAWYDCNFTEQLSTAETFNPDTAGCYCLVANHSFCSDTICSTYEPNPCDAVCNLVQEQACTGESVLFTYDGEIPVGAKLHWLIDLPGESQTYFSGADSLLLQYNTVGCYSVSLTIVDSTTTFTCVDSFCVVESTATVSICCNTIACDTCTTITIELTGASPWTLYISDGINTDTIADVEVSPYLHVVCPPSDTTITYSIQATDSIGLCPATITGDANVDISLYSTPDVSIIQTIDTLCASLPGINTYNWFNCIPAGNLSTTQCFIPLSSGCYCVEVTTDGGCADTACYDFILSAASPIETNLMSISPVPSKGTWEVNFTADVVLPVEWALVNLWGEQLEQGKLENQKSTIQLSGTPPSGLYILKFVTSDRQVMTAKVILQRE